MAEFYSCVEAGVEIPDLELAALDKLNVSLPTLVQEPVERSIAGCEGLRQDRNQQRGPKLARILGSVPCGFGVRFSETDTGVSVVLACKNDACVNLEAPRSTAQTIQARAKAVVGGGMTIQN